MSSHSTDACPPQLMEELQAMRAPFRAAYDTLWRRERAFRYVYWLDHHECPSFNLIGSWTTPDLQAERALWKAVRDDKLDDTEIVDQVTGLLEQRFGLPFDSMIERAMDPTLAERALPVWNQATESLLPQTLGHWRIKGMTDSKKPGLGQSYAYRHTDADSTLTLYLYDHGLDDIEPGISDPRLRQEVATCIVDIETLADTMGSEITWYMQPSIEVIRSHSDTEIRFVSATWLIVDADRTRRVGAFSLTGFRRNFLKIRITGAEPFVESDEGQSDTSALNLDLAQFVEQFGP